MSQLRGWIAIVAVAACAFTTTLAERAEACGGCFVPPGPSTQVSAHRMALAVSARRTVLWDQIQYVGDPKEFGWVLPIRGKVDVGVSSDGFFERLEGVTAPRVTPPPPPTCPKPQRKCIDRCPSLSGADAGVGAETSAGAFDAASVDVWSTTVVGPYEATQLSATDGAALRNWLKEHDYVLPEEIGPIVDRYVKEGFGFLVVKLVPNTGVTRMEPIRIGFDGSSPNLPLRMVAAGTGARVGIKLFVLGEGRWESKTFAAEEVRTADLVWDWRTSTSNFGTLELSLIAKHDGAVFITETSDDWSKASLVEGLPKGTTSVDGGPTVFSSITDKSELDRAFPSRTEITVSRLFAELPQSALAQDLEVQASLAGKIPAIRQAPKGVNYDCPQYEWVDCGPTSCEGDDATGAFGRGSTAEGGGQFGCNASSSRATPIVVVALAGLSLLGVGLVRRRSSRFTMEKR